MNLYCSRFPLCRRALAPLLVVALLISCKPASEAKDVDTEHQTRKPLPSAAEIAKLPADGGPEFNRLVFSGSPYLLQHARNPVDWHPWGEDAFALAKKLDKAIFLSVGYATCHWCHVMEHESFEDEAVAKLMNEAFVCVKVDREERPDVDQIYMTVTQMMTGSGGWPMTVVMTPDRRPFFAGTYFPKSGRYGRPGMMELVPALSKAWREQRSEVEASATKAVAALVENNRAKDAGALPDATALTKAYRQLAESYDPHHGGFGQAPKFPTPHNLSFLLRQQLRGDGNRALAMVEKTLQSMRHGGVFDHLGFGYHRYSTDSKWLVPHFEKMLYDQALIAIAALECHQLTGDPQYADQAREIFTYVARDMTHADGGFFSAEDADSEGEEGRFYVWSTKEIRKLLPAADAELFIEVYNCSDEGNFHDEATRARTGTNIPHLQQALAAIAKSKNLSVAALKAKLDSSRQRLFDARTKRVRPLLDDKVLTDWNGLMIAALAIGGRALADDDLSKRASRAANFAWANLRTPQNRLHKRWRNGKAGLTGLLDDYAFMTWGLIELYQTTLDVSWLEKAITLHLQVREHFRDDTNGGFFLTPDDGEKLLVRSREIYDGAIPSGNAVVARNALRLARLTGDAAYSKDAEGVMRSFSTNISRHEAAHTMSLQALDLLLGPSKEIVVASPDEATAKPYLAAIQTAFLPRAVWHLRTPQNADSITKIAPYLTEQVHDDKRPQIYVCENFACQLPTDALDKMLKLLGLPHPQP